MLDAAAAHDLAALAAEWPLVTVSAGSDTTAPRITLAAGDVPFAWIGQDGLDIVVPPRVRDMLVETGRATALADPRHARVDPDPDLLRLAYERARVTQTPQAPDGRP